MRRLLLSVLLVFLLFTIAGCNFFGNYGNDEVSTPDPALVLGFTEEEKQQILSIAMSEAANLNLPAVVPAVSFYRFDVKNELGARRLATIVSYDEAIATATYGPESTAKVYLYEAMKKRAGHDFDYFAFAGALPKETVDNVLNAISNHLGDPQFLLKSAQNLDEVPSVSLIIQEEVNKLEIPSAQAFVAVPVGTQSININLKPRFAKLGSAILARLIFNEELINFFKSIHEAGMANSPLINSNVSMQKLSLRATTDEKNLQHIFHQDSISYFRTHHFFSVDTEVEARNLAPLYPRYSWSEYLLRHDIVRFGLATETAAIAPVYNLTWIPLESGAFDLKIDFPEGIPPLVPAFTEQTDVRILDYTLTTVQGGSSPGLFGGSPGFLACTEYCDDHRDRVTRYTSQKRFQDTYLAGNMPVRKFKISFIPDSRKETIDRSILVSLLEGQPNTFLFENVGPFRTGELPELRMQFVETDFDDSFKAFVSQKKILMAKDTAWPEYKSRGHPLDSTSVSFKDEDLDAEISFGLIGADGNSKEYLTKFSTFVKVDWANLLTATSQTILIDKPDAVEIVMGDLTEFLGQPLTYKILQNPTKGILSGVSGNRVTFTPYRHASAHGTDFFTFSVAFNGSESVMATVTLNLTINAPPIANAQTVSVLKNTPVNIVLTGTNPDGPGMTFILLSQPNHGTLSGNSPNLTYTPEKDYLGTDSFYFQIDNGIAKSEAALVKIDMPNQAPVFGNDGTVNVVNAGTTQVEVSWSATDDYTPSDQIEYDISVWGFLEIKWPDIIFDDTPVVYQVGNATSKLLPCKINQTYRLRVRAIDKHGAVAYSEFRDFTFIATANQPPIIASNGGGATAAISVAENTTAVTTVIATDADAGQTITYGLTGGADQSKFAIDANSGVLVLKIAPDHETPTDIGAENTYEVQVTADDGNGGQDSQTITVTITDVAESLDPTITSSNTFSMAENQTAVSTVTATGANVGQAIVFSISGGADQAKFSIDSSSGALSFKVAPDVEVPGDSDGNNVYLLTVTVTNGPGSSAFQNLSITVTGVNDLSPVFTSAATASVQENTLTVLNVTATDAELPAQTVTYVISGGTDQSKFNLNTNTGALTFNTEPDFEVPSDADANNIYLVEVTANDGAGRTTSQQISVTVTDAVNPKIQALMIRPTSMGDNDYGIRVGDKVRIAFSQDMNTGTTITGAELDALLDFSDGYADGNQFSLDTIFVSWITSKVLEVTVIAEGGGYDIYAYGGEKVNFTSNANGVFKSATGEPVDGTSTGVGLPVQMVTMFSSIKINSSAGNSNTIFGDASGDVLRITFNTSMNQSIVPTAADLEKLFNFVGTDVNSNFDGSVQIAWISPTELTVTANSICTTNLNANSNVQFGTESGVTNLPVDSVFGFALNRLNLSGSSVLTY